MFYKYIPFTKKSASTAFPPCLRLLTGTLRIRQPIKMESAASMRQPIVRLRIAPVGFSPWLPCSRMNFASSLASFLSCFSCSFKGFSWDFSLFLIFLCFRCFWKRSKFNWNKLSHLGFIHLLWHFSSRHCITFRLILLTFTVLFGIFQLFLLLLLVAGNLLIDLLR